jgi:hypothetical protein
MYDILYLCYVHIKQSISYIGLLLVEYIVSLLCKHHLEPKIKIHRIETVGGFCHFGQVLLILQDMIVDRHKT